MKDLFFAVAYFAAMNLSLAQIAIAPVSSGKFSLFYFSTRDRPWRIQSSADLATWLDLPTVTMGDGTQQQGTVTSNTTCGFWRVREFTPDAAYKPASGPFTMAPFVDESWNDASRNYLMPVRIYAPAIGQSGAPFPTIVLSHGLGGSIGAFDSLSAYLTSHGFICIMIGHDDTRQDNRVQRPKDVTFALDRLLDLPSNALLAGRVDATRIAHVGHSFGAFTSLALLGARYHLTDDSSSPIVGFPDERVKCGIAYSPQGATTAGLFDGSWNSISRPAFTLHGTLDTAPGTTDPTTRHQPYEQMQPGNKAHLTLADAVHNDFTDNGITNHFTSFTQWYFPASLAFLEAHLNHDPAAAAWLDALAISRLSNGSAVLETK